MVRLRKYFGLVLSALLTYGAILQSQEPNADSASGEQFPVGMWEATQSDGITVGIHLSVVPPSVPDAVFPAGTPIPQGSHLQIGVFQRKHKRLTYGDENFFVTGWTGPGSEDGGAVYANRKLEVHYHDRHSGSEIHLELALDPIKDAWTGQFHRDGFDRQVTLLRVSDRPEIAAPKLMLTSTDTPSLFRIEMQNLGTQDLALNLGIVLSGREQYVMALAFTLTAPDGRVLQLESPGPGIIAARVDPLIVPLPSGATYSILVDLDECLAPKEKISKLHFLPGKYILQAEFTGRAVSKSEANPDIAGITATHFWVGVVTSTPVEFTVQ
jgi:hypothetical protein